MSKKLTGLQRLWLVATATVFFFTFFMAFYGVNLYPYTPRPFGDISISIYNTLVYYLFDLGFDNDFWLAIFEALPRAILFSISTFLLFAAGKWIIKGFKP